MGTQKLIVTENTMPGALFDDDFFKDFDASFEQIKVTPKAKASGKRTRKQKAEIEAAETYLELTQLHLKPVHRYLKAVDQGVASRELCELIHYVVGPMVLKTKSVGLAEQTKALIGFQRVLKKIVQSNARKLSETVQAELQEKFLSVRDLFRLDFRGHSSAVVNLLGFYRHLRRKKAITEADIKKLFAIGIPSITMLRKINLEELSGLTGLNREKATLIRRTAREFNLLSLL